MPELDAYDHLFKLFGDLDDPRMARGKRHALADVLFILLVGVLAGQEDAEGIHDFATYQQDWFAQRCELRHGIPSQDTFLRILAALEPEAFGEVFQRWVRRVWGLEALGHVAIDGKAMRRSFNRAAGVSPVHSVAAFASEQGLVLGQVAVQDKENEILAIPKLLMLIDLNGATVTIDAMGCQKKIAETIIEGGGEYILHVKGNQPTLQEHIEGFFNDASRSQRTLDDPMPEVEEFYHTDGGHGRIEERWCRLSRDLSWIDDREAWAGLGAIAEITRRREDLSSGKVSLEKSYYIVSGDEKSAERVNDLVRFHWGIENKVHWVLDVTFDEDGSRVRTGNAAENLGTIRRLALNLLRSAPNPLKQKRKVSTRRRRNAFLLNPAYRETVLTPKGTP
jgi:predicted transposase YbfD/YdcC